MSIVSDFKARLSAIDPAIFAIVEGASEFAAVDGIPLALPAAYVFIKEEASDASARSTGPVLQRCELDVAVIIIAGNVSDQVGAAAAGDIEDLKQKTRGALIGFVPAAATDGTPVEHVSGQLIRFRSGTIWHEETYSTVTYIEEQS